MSVYEINAFETEAKNGNERVKIDCFREILIDAESCRVRAVLFMLKITVDKEKKE
jgi:ABC-type uncharacterized transport system auxiliary subunit